MKTRNLTQTAIFAALLCIICPLAIPAGAIPVTLAILVLLITAYILPIKQAKAAVGIYLMLGGMGLPVFSGGQAGFGALLGASGGYLWSYLPAAAIAGAGRGRGRGRLLVCGALALVLCYACGTIQYALVAAVDLRTAFAACVLPFVFFDGLKLAMACLLSEKIRSRLLAAGLLV